MFLIVGVPVTGMLAGMDLSNPGINLSKPGMNLSKPGKKHRNHVIMTLYTRYAMQCDVVHDIVLHYENTSAL